MTGRGRLQRGCYVHFGLLGAALATLRRANTSQEPSRPSESQYGCSAKPAFGTYRRLRSSGILTGMITILSSRLRIPGCRNQKSSRVFEIFLELRTCLALCDHLLFLPWQSCRRSRICPKPRGKTELDNSAIRIANERCRTRVLGARPSEDVRVLGRRDGQHIA